MGRELFALHAMCEVTTCPWRCLVYPVSMGIEQSIKDSALRIGFDLAGVASLDVGGDLDFARDWVEQGRGGEMDYLRNPKRFDPLQVLPTARSVVCVGLVYNSALPYSTEIHTFPRRISPRGGAEARLSGANSPGGDSCASPAQTGWISRYAWGEDYHPVMKDKLESLRHAIEDLASGVETRVYVDTGPLVERAFTRFSGVGWTGKNTCLINQEKGSWFFLGVLLTNLALRPDLPAPDRCGSCRRCVDACPTGALDQPYCMDASRCIAYLTIELKGPIPTELRPAIGVNVFGCDICQDVCPWNSRPSASLATAAEGHALLHDSVADREARGAAHTSVREFQPRRLPASVPASGGATEFSLFNPPLDALASMTEEEFALNFRRSPIKRAKFQGFMRDVCVALGNSGNQDFLPTLERLAEHENPLIREHAIWALADLQKSMPPAADGI